MVHLNAAYFTAGCRWLPGRWCLPRCSWQVLCPAVDLPPTLSAALLPSPGRPCSLLLAFALPCMLRVHVHHTPTGSWQQSLQKISGEMQTACCSACACCAGTGLALPYTPIGRVEQMQELPPSFYAWVAATMAGGAPVRCSR